MARMCARLNRRRSAGKLEDFPLVGRPAKAVLSTVSRPLQKVHDVVDKQVLRRGRRAIALVGKPLTKATRSLGKRSRKGTRSARKGRRSGRR